MDTILFFLFATVAVVCAINLVVQRHPIGSALSLIGVMCSLAVSVPAVGCGVSRRGANHCLCRRGDGVVCLRHHAVERGHREIGRQIVVCADCRSAVAAGVRSRDGLRDPRISAAVSRRRVRQLGGRHGSRRSAARCLKATIYFPLRLRPYPGVDCDLRRRRARAKGA